MAKSTNDFDVTKLQVEEVATMPKATRGSTLASNPFISQVRDSKADGKGRRVVVPGPATEKRSVKNPKTGKATQKVTDGPAVRKVRYLLNQAANHLNLGVRIISTELDNGSVEILFQGKERKASKKDAA